MDIQDLGRSLTHRFASDLPALCVAWSAQAAPSPQWLQFNTPLAQQLGLDVARASGPEGLAVFSGHALARGSHPVAQAYAGHQFGGFSPQLGDGRALLLGELTTPDGACIDLALKGSGPTPFARGGDGKAAIGPMLREYLISEAMHALGIPTTRTLAVVATGETVYRERPLPGALICRTAASHIRVGTFEYLATRGSTADMQALLQHTLARHDPHLIDTDTPALALLNAVIERQAALVARWMGVGFIHGVMNTDNMTLSGETIDYGPCAFMEAHDPRAVFSSIDRHGRYAYSNQPRMAQWNLARLAQALLPLIHPNIDQALDLAHQAIDRFADHYEAQWQSELRAKLGLAASDATEADTQLAESYLALLHAHQVDHTLGFRQLSHVLRGNRDALHDVFGNAAAVASWLDTWLARVHQQALPASEVAHVMDTRNPCVIPRNHEVELALQAATEDADLAPFEALLNAVRQPYTPPHDARYAQAAPAAYTQNYRTFCGT